MSLNFSQVKSLTIPEGKVKSITRKSDGLLLWKSGYKNWARFSTEADGVTIYNNGLGYKNGYRIRSGGAEGVTDIATCTGFIPAKAGDIIRWTGCDAMSSSTANAINVYTDGKENLGQVVANTPSSGYGIFAPSGQYYNYGWLSVVENPTGQYLWVVPPHPDIRFIRLTGETGGDGSELIITVNQEIK